MLVKLDLKFQVLEAHQAKSYNYNKESQSLNLGSPQSRLRDKDLGAKIWEVLPGNIDKK